MITTSPWEMTEAYKSNTEHMIKKATKRFYDDLSDKSIRRPAPGNVIWFNIFKKMSTLSKKSIPADYEFYKDRNFYFYNVKEIHYIHSWEN